MNTESKLLRALESPAVSIIGITADVAATVVILFDDGFMRWVSGHSAVIIILISVALLLNIATYNALITSRKRIILLEDKVRNLESAPSPQDVERFARFWAEFGEESPLYDWMKNDFLADKARYVQLKAMDHVTDSWSRSVTNYHDSELAESFSGLKESLRSLSSVINSNYWPMDNRSSLEDMSFYGIPGEWTSDRTDEAVDAIGAAWDCVMDNYKHFVNLAHEKKVTQH